MSPVGCHRCGDTRFLRLHHLVHSRYGYGIWCRIKILLDRRWAKLPSLRCAPVSLVGREAIPFRSLWMIRSLLDGLPHLSPIYRPPEPGFYDHWKLMDSPSARMLRELEPVRPIIVLSAIGSEEEDRRIRHWGPDDYLVLPLGMEDSSAVAGLQYAVGVWWIPWSDRPGSHWFFKARWLLIDTDAPARLRLKGEQRNDKTHPSWVRYFSLSGTACWKVISHRELLKAVWGNVYGENESTASFHFPIAS